MVGDIAHTIACRMSTGNCVRNTQLTAMLKAAEKSQSDRLRQNLREFTENRLQPLPPRRPPPKVQEDKENTETTCSTQAMCSNPHDIRAETVPLTLDEIEWLDEVVERHGHSGKAGAISRLIDWANQESPEAKKQLFLVVRCRRCSAGAKGGVKRDHSIELSSQQWQWLQNVRERCRHASTGKTIRIIVDFYMSVCKDDFAFEQKVLRAGAAQKTKKHEDAVNSVDPTLAPLSPELKPARSPTKSMEEPLVELSLSPIGHGGA